MKTCCRLFLLLSVVVIFFIFIQNRQIILQSSTFFTEMGTKGKFDPIRIEDVPMLNAAWCHMKDRSNVERLLNAMASGGPDNLQLISDFDFTITRQYRPDGSTMPTSFCILNHCKSLPEAWRIETPKAVIKYLPIEQDNTLPMPQRIAAVEEWSRLTSSLLTGFSMDEDELIDAASVMGSDCLRMGTKDMFENLHALGIPILVFSAGLGDSVVAILKATKVFLPNVEVVSNFLVRREGLIQGLNLTRIIHSFNKNEAALYGSASQKRFEKRTNVLLLGDSLGDSDMANGCPENANVLKIGFLWDKVEVNLPLYLDSFDIVLVDDQTMHTLQAIIAQILHSTIPIYL